MGTLRTLRLLPAMIASRVKRLAARLTSSGTSESRSVAECIHGVKNPSVGIVAVRIKHAICYLGESREIVIGYCKEWNGGKMRVHQRGKRGGSLRSRLFDNGFTWLMLICESTLDVSDLLIKNAITGHKMGPKVQFSSIIHLSIHQLVILQSFQSTLNSKSSNKRQLTSRTH
jgi:hypothetical protein